jgi:hypothetical protein
MCSLLRTRDSELGKRMKEKKQTENYGRRKERSLWRKKEQLTVARLPSNGRSSF